MPSNLIEDFRNRTGVAFRLTSLLVIVAILFFITISFLCAAAFIFVLQRFDLIYACLTGAGIFFAVTLIAAGCYWYHKRQAKKRSIESKKSAFVDAISDPVMLALGLQVVRAVGIRRLLPLLTVGAIAFGFMAQRKPSQKTPAE